MAAKLFLSHRNILVGICPRRYLRNHHNHRYGQLPEYKSCDGKSGKEFESGVRLDAGGGRQGAGGRRREAGGGRQGAKAKAKAKAEAKAKAKTGALVGLIAEKSFIQFT